MAKKNSPPKTTARKPAKLPLRAKKGKAMPTMTEAISSEEQKLERCLQLSNKSSPLDLINGSKLLMNIKMSFLNLAEMCIPSEESI